VTALQTKTKTRSGEDPRPTGGLVSHLSHPWVKEQSNTHTPFLKTLIDSKMVVVPSRLSPLHQHSTRAFQYRTLSSQVVKKNPQTLKN